MFLLLMKRMNKRADKIISVYWFAILFIVAAAVVYMVAVFYGEPYDVRKIEAGILTNRISDCLSEGGYLILENLNKEDFMERCNLNFDVEDDYNWKEEGQYFFDVEVLDFESENMIFGVDGGNVNLGILCKDKIDESLQCLGREFYSLDENQNQYKIKILSVVRKTEKNA